MIKIETIKIYVAEVGQVGSYEVVKNDKELLGIALISIEQGKAFKTYKEAYEVAQKQYDEHVIKWEKIRAEKEKQKKRGR